MCGYLCFIVNLVVYLSISFISLLFQGIILKTSIPLLKESSMILMQTVPTHIKIQEIQSRLVERIPGVISVHEFHIWQLAGNRIIGWFVQIFSNNTFPSRYLLVQSSSANTRTMCEICSKLLIKTPEQRCWHIVLVSLLWTLSRFHTFVSLALRKFSKLNSWSYSWLFIRYHPFCTYEKFYEKLTFTVWYALLRVCVRG